MLRRIFLELALAIALVLAIAPPALAVTASATVYDGSGQTGAFCGGITSGDSDLTSFGGCGNWDNRISSVTFSSTTHCMGLWLGFSRTGSEWSIHTSGSYNAPSGFNNAASSLAFGTWHDGGPDDRFCDAPYF